MTNDHKAQVLAQLIRRRGFTKIAACKRLGITRPTLNTMLTKPMTIDGTKRHQLADMLGVEVELIDRVINGKLTYTLQTVNQLLDHVTPLSHDAQNAIPRGGHPAA